MGESLKKYEKLMKDLEGNEEWQYKVTIEKGLLVDKIIGQKRNWVLYSSLV